jgi:hypothetical protein
MSLSWIAQIVFFTSYFVAWVINELPHSTWITVSAIAAIVIAVLLVIDNRGVIDRRPQA